MTHRFRSSLTCFVLLALGSHLSLAQHGEPMDVEKCFPSILQDSRVDINKERIKYAILANWNKELFDSAKSRAVMETLVPEYGYSNNDFEQTQDKILKFFFSKNENLEYTRDTASAAFYLDPQASVVIGDCLNAMSRRGYGLSYSYYLDGPYKATLELFWSWVPSEAPLLVRTKSLSNARVIDDHKSHPDSLLPVARGPEWGQLEQPSDVITLVRLKPDEPIVANIAVKPNVGARHIVIPPVRRKRHCDPVTLTADESGAFQQTFPFKLDAQPRVSDDGHGHKYFNYHVDIESLQNGKGGLLRDATCVKISGPGVPADFAEVTAVKKDPKYAECQGWWQELGRMASMTVYWYKTGFQCKDEEWPPPEDVASPSRAKARPSKSVQ